MNDHGRIGRRLVGPIARLGSAALAITITLALLKFMLLIAALGVEESRVQTVAKVTPATKMR